MVELLAALSASTAAGIRIALPLLVIGLLQGDKLWSQVPLLSYLPPPVMFGVLVSWSLIELFASKTLWGQRVLQVFQLLLCPIAGAVMAISTIQSNNSTLLIWIIGVVGGSFALLLQLIQASWLYRLQVLPLWVFFGQDALCIALVFLALYAPLAGGLIALILLWLSIRSYQQWQREKRRRL